jgi:hypothetical protein
MLATILSWFASFTKLKMFDLSSSNFIQGLFLEWVQVMLNLQYHDLAYYNLTHQISRFLGG